MTPAGCMLAIGNHGYGSETHFCQNSRNFCRYFIASWSATSFEPVCDQLRTSFEPDSVMEFGFYAIWLEAGSKLVAYRFEAGRRPASNQIA